jgi:acyl dehydratase
VIELEELQQVVGKPFPGGKYTIEPYRHWLMADAALDEPPRGEGVANPMWVYYAALAGMGISVDDVFTMCGAAAADGPMFGETTLELLKPLQIGATYDVSGEFTEVQRKEGRRAGVFDIVEFRLELKDESGELAAISTNSFVFPRRD